MTRTLALALTLVASPALADVPNALTTHLLPGFHAFSTASTALAASARQDCRAEAVQPAYQAAFDAWMAVGDLRIGPSEQGALSIAFWPDDRGFTGRTLSRMIAASDPAVNDPATFAEVSIAARGFFALDMLLYDPAFAYEPGSYPCTLVQAVAEDLAAQAEALETTWAGKFTEALTNPGAPDNALYLTEEEALRAVYTQLLAGLEMTADSRLGRPMGSFERPRPRLAEAWRSGRSLRNVVLSVEAAQALAHALADWDLPQTDAAVAQVHFAAGNIDDGSFQDVTDAVHRLHLEALQQAVRAVRAALEIEIGERLGIAPGFNSQDGD
ncbi:MAG: imelysin family protein [Rhodobacter sp.]|nr:imelysin family protein [Paracoccaceae bacterium]MCC0076372.1 imelysin family protein [Rhodobacter sp.]